MVIDTTDGDHETTELEIIYLSFSWVTHILNGDW